jgi:hypothetical protein
VVCGPWRAARRGGPLRAGRVCLRGRREGLPGPPGRRRRGAGHRLAPLCLVRTGSFGGRPGSTASVAGATCCGLRVWSWPTCWRWPRGRVGRARAARLVDQEVAGLVGIGEPEEYPLVLVGVEAPTVAEPAGRPPPVPISPRTWPLSRWPRSCPSSPPPSAPASSPAPRRSAPGATRPPGSRHSPRPGRVLSATPARLALPPRHDRGGDAPQGLDAALRTGAAAPRRAALGDGDCHPTRPRRLHPTASDAAGAPGGRARGGWLGARGLSVQPGRFPAASNRSGAPPHPRALPGAGPWRRFGRDRLSLRPPGAHPAGVGARKSVVGAELRVRRRSHRRR